VSGYSARISDVVWGKRFISVTLLTMVWAVLFVIVTASVASLTRLITTDKITRKWRLRLFEKYGENSFISGILDCDRCASVWAAILHMPFTLGGLCAAGLIAWWSIPLLAVPFVLGVSYLGFLLLQRGES